MRLISISMRRPGCGVSDYAGELENAFERLGHRVSRAGFGSAVSCISKGRFDRVIAHFELVESSRSGEVLKLFGLVRYLRSHGLKPTIISHTLLARAPHGRFQKLIWPLVSFYQKAVLKMLGDRADLVVLNASAVDILREAGITARYVPFGIYGQRTTEKPSRLAKFQDRVVVALVGHPYAFKRFAMGARAFANLPEAFRRRGVFAVVGGDPSVDEVSWRALEAVLSSLPPEQVCVTGQLSDDEFWLALRDVDIALIPYEPRATASAVVAKLVAAEVPMLVSDSSAFHPVVRVGGAVAVHTWPEDATSELQNLFHSEKRSEMRSALNKLASAESLEATAARLIAGS